MKIQSTPAPLSYKRPQTQALSAPETEPKDGFASSTEAPDWLLPASAATAAGGAFLMGGAMLASHVSLPLTVALGAGSLGAISAGFTGLILSCVLGQK